MLDLASNSSPPSRRRFVKLASNLAGGSPSAADAVGDAIMAPYVPIVGTTSVTIPSAPIAVKAALSLPMASSSSKPPTPGPMTIKGTNLIIQPWTAVQALFAHTIPYGWE
ncbi:hypothetical protein EW146_g10254 [Bondarzewia mesenterica]|uniref:Uncharacterized protein n=1 Tax=Bondarzewia mesenterica TaxID=1095465 RepID=A0A4S4L3Q6_9AGAM|nr:hypothetical protein EW146_g10254 [Bondarzewia mesenterica]